MWEVRGHTTGLPSTGAGGGIHTHPGLSPPDLNTSCASQGRSGSIKARQARAVLQSRVWQIPRFPTLSSSLPTLRARGLMMSIRWEASAADLPGNRRARVSVGSPQSSSSQRVKWCTLPVMMVLGNQLGAAAAGLCWGSACAGLPRGVESLMSYRSTHVPFKVTGVKGQFVDR